MILVVVVDGDGSGCGCGGDSGDCNSGAHRASNKQF